jgi:hypothetical protein
MCRQRGRCVGRHDWRAGGNLQGSVFAS